MARRNQQAYFDYEGFVEKFKPRLTTDDCSTPPEIYETVREWAVAEYHLQGREVVRPFWPGKDYQAAKYPAWCVVIDNPPFSILSQIVRWYNGHGIDYFLFAHHKTNLGIKETNHLLTDALITYENGANIPAAFVTNLGRAKIRAAGTLSVRLDEKMGEIRKAKRKMLSKRKWPRELCTFSRLGTVARYGVEFEALPEEVSQTSKLDSGRAIYGSGYWLGAAAAERLAAAERAAAAERQMTRETMSDRERALCAGLGAVEGEA